MAVKDWYLKFICKEMHTEIICSHYSWPHLSKRQVVKPRIAIPKPTALMNLILDIL